MLDIEQIERIISRSDIIMDVLNRRSKITFKLGFVRTKVAFIGYQFIWGEWDRDKLTSELLDLGFDNLTLTQIVECIVFLKGKMLEWKSNPKRVTDPVKLARMEEHVKANVRRNISRGKF